MKRLAVLLVVAAALLAPATGAAHPLGNFTINRFSRVEVSVHRVYVRYGLDLAEIPTFQAGHIDARAYARRIARNAQLVVNGKTAQLVPLGTALAHPAGAAGLRTTRLEVILAGPALNGKVSISYQDNNYKDRIGWKEIVVGPTAGSISDELRAYPKNMLQSPLDITSVKTDLAPRNGPDVPPALSSGKTLEAPDRVADAGFSSLIGRHHLSAHVILASLAAAFFWGMAHALSPGHGKTIVAAYLVSRRGTPWHAAALGAIVTATHTIGVFALGLVTLALSAFIVPEQLYPWLNLVSGVLVVAIGATVFRSRYRHRGGHAHDHGHDHHEHEAPSRRSLVAVGITGGLLPCPSALVVLLAAISLHRVAFGMLLIIAFSAGLALSITGIGLVAVFAKQIFKRASFEGRLVRLLPAASALVILAAGLAMTVRALPKVS
jgi:nickel/cobalt transporter (NicO) family protein